jgi:hypothetical protein
MVWGCGSAGAGVARIRIELTVTSRVTLAGCEGAMVACGHWQRRRMSLFAEERRMPARVNVIGCGGAGGQCPPKGGQLTTTLRSMPP